MSQSLLRTDTGKVLFLELFSNTNTYRRVSNPFKSYPILKSDMENKDTQVPRVILPEFCYKPLEKSYFRIVSPHGPPDSFRRQTSDLCAGEVTCWLNACWEVEFRLLQRTLRIPVL